MAVFNLFSKRLTQRGTTRTTAEVESEPELSAKLRVQICYVLDDLLGKYVEDRYGQSPSARMWREVTAQVAREWGQAGFPCVRENVHANPQEVCLKYIQNPKLSEYTRVFDVLESAFLVAKDLYTRVYNLRPFFDALQELNERFREEQCPFRVNPDYLRIVRVDCEVLETDNVQPALVLLREHQHVGAEQEMFEALQHRRFGRNKDANVSALRALESTMKSILDRRGIEYDRNRATCSKLVNHIVKGGLLPGFSQNVITKLEALLKTAAPTVRNKLGGHGQGSEIRDAEDHLTEFAIHSACAAVVLLLRADSQG